MLAAHASQRDWLRAQHGEDEYLLWMRRMGRDRARDVGDPSVEYAEGFAVHRGHGFPTDDLLTPAAWSGRRQGRVQGRLATAAGIVFVFVFVFAFGFNLHSALRTPNSELSGSMFSYSLASFIAFRDAAECARVRAIRRADITRHRNPAFRIEVIDEPIGFYSRFAIDIVTRIQRAAEEGRRCVS